MISFDGTFFFLLLLLHLWVVLILSDVIWITNCGCNMVKENKTITGFGLHKNFARHMTRRAGVMILMKRSTLEAIRNH